MTPSEFMAGQHGYMTCIAGLATSFEKQECMCFCWPGKDRPTAAKSTAPRPGSPGLFRGVPNFPHPVKLPAGPKHRLGASRLIAEPCTGGDGVGINFRKAQQ